MKITEKWLRNRDVCGSGIDLYKKIGETNPIKILDSLVQMDKLNYAHWLIMKIIYKCPLIGYKNSWEFASIILEKKYKLNIITPKQALVWFKEQEFTHIDQREIFGRYFKCDSEGFANMIRWNYNDSEDCYYVKWQAWWGNDKKRTEFIKICHVPDRDVYLEAETDSFKIDEHYGFHEIMIYIKKNNNKMIKACKDNINKRLNKLQS